MDISLTALAFACGAVLLAAVTHGMTGFGFALVSTPLLLLILPPRTVVPLLALHSTVTGSILLYQLRRWVDLRRIWPLMVAGALGAPLGAYLLAILDAGTLKMLIGALMALSALALLLGFHREIRDERLACGPVGLASGLLNGSTGMGGPPVILFFANQGVEKQVFRANLAAYFMVLNAVTVYSYLAGGLLTPEVLRGSALLLPAALLGLGLGARLAARVEEQLFRRVTLAVVILAGMLAIASGWR